MSLTVDASVFVAAARSAEQHYADSLQFLTDVQTQAEMLICPVLVLAECAAAIARPTGNPDLTLQLVGLIEALPHLQLVPITHLIARRAAQLAADHRLRGADSIYVAVAEQSGSVLIAWDKEMLERAAQVVRTMTPTDWLAREP